MSQTSERILGNPPAPRALPPEPVRSASVAAPAVKADPGDGSRLFRSTGQRVLALVGMVLVVGMPLSVDSPFLVSLGITVGIYAVAAVGLNVLVGYTGMISLSHSVFMGVGGFASVGLAGLIGLPLWIWLPGSALAGALMAALVAPLTLRLRGVFQIILSLALIFIGLYLFVNIPVLTGGNAGISASPSLRLGPLDFAALEMFGMTYGYGQGLFILVWLLVGLCMAGVANMMRTRFGRAMVAVREGETAAQLAGVNTNSVKARAFVIAGALGGLAGGLLLAQLRYLNAEQFGINLGLELLIITVVGGLGLTWGPVAGSLVVASIPVLANRYAEALPLLKADYTEPGFGMPVAQVGLFVFGLALVLVMVFEPRGLAHIVSAALRRAGRAVRGPRGARNGRADDVGALPSAPEAEAGSPREATRSQIETARPGASG